jgi:hypothetical protein
MYLNCNMTHTSHNARLPTEIIWHIYSFSNIDTKLLLHKAYGSVYFRRRPLNVPLATSQTLSNMVKMKLHKIELHNLIDSLFVESNKGSGLGQIIHQFILVV